MLIKEIFQIFGIETEIFKRFRSELKYKIDDDKRISNKYRRWREIFQSSHGDVFANLKEIDDKEIYMRLSYFYWLTNLALSSLENLFCISIENKRAELADRIFPQPETFKTILKGRSKLRKRFVTREGVLNAEEDYGRKLYEEIMPRNVRKSLGEYYTPRSLAEVAINSLNVSNWEESKFLDPGCGSGIFPYAIIRRKIESLSGSKGDVETLQNILETVHGADISPIAVQLGKISYLVGMAPILLKSWREKPIHVPVFWADSLNLGSEIEFPDKIPEKYDYLVGNPPWVRWGVLPQKIKFLWKKRYVDELSLLPHRGIKKRLGYSEDDISVPFIWVCMHRHLKVGGKSSFVLKRGLMRGEAGRLFRRLKIKDEPLKLIHIYDFSDLNPFEEVQANVAIYTFEYGSKPEFPVKVKKFERKKQKLNFRSRRDLENTTTQHEYNIEPIQEDKYDSDWVNADLERECLGKCEHKIRHGIKSDAKDVFELGVSELKNIEKDLVYPFLKSRYVAKWGIFGHTYHLIPVKKANEKNINEIRRRYPKTYQYLDQNREILQNRKSSWLKAGEFYNLFGIGEYTWKLYKVIWCRLGYAPHFAVVSKVKDKKLGEKLVIPGDHFMFIPTNSRLEAHFLAGLLNSQPYQDTLDLISLREKVSLSGSVVSKLKLPKYQNIGIEKKIAQCSIKAHDWVDENRKKLKKSRVNHYKYTQLREIKEDLDKWVSKLLEKIG